MISKGHVVIDILYGLARWSSHHSWHEPYHNVRDILNLWIHCTVPVDGNVASPNNSWVRSSNTGFPQQHYNIRSVSILMGHNRYFCISPSKSIFVYRNSTFFVTLPVLESENPLLYRTIYDILWFQLYMVFRKSEYPLPHGTTIIVVWWGYIVLAF